MLSKATRTWVFLVVMMTLTVCIIDTIAVNLPPGRLRTGLMVGAALFGFGSQLAWLYYQQVK
jgi:hypothetical protein